MINAPKEMQDLYLLFEISQSLFIIKIDYSIPVMFLVTVKCGNRGHFLIA